MPELPGNLLRHPMLNANSRYFAPALPMAPGTRTPNARKLADVCAGLPRDQNTKLPAKAVAGLRAVFCLPATTQTAPKQPDQKAPE